MKAIRAGIAVVALVGLAIGQWISANTDAPFPALAPARASFLPSTPARSPRASGELDCAPDWSVVAGPNLGESDLNAMAAVSAGDVWAVGYYGHGSGARTLAERWDGSAWSMIPSPGPGNGGSQLNGVAAVSSSDVWAVGSYAPGSAVQTLVEHWDGSAWSVVSSPNVGPGGNQLTGVATVSAGDVWAVGYYFEGSFPRTLAEHWDGAAWSVVPSPNPDIYQNLYAVSAVSAGDVWAVGEHRSGPVSRTLVEHWDGAAWSVVSSPNVGTSSNQFNSVAAISSSDVWVVGSYRGGPLQTLVEHWDGSAWSTVQSPNAGGDNLLYGVAAVSSGDVWAVGFRIADPIFQTLIEHWDGSAWSMIPSPNPDTRVNALYAVSAVSAGDVWAAGYYEVPYQALAVRYNPCTGPATPTPARTDTPARVPTATNTPLPSTSTSTPGAPAATNTPLPTAPPATPSATATGEAATATNTRMPTPLQPTVTGTSTPAPCVTGFSDVRPEDYFYEAVRYLYCHGAISGYSDGTFRPFSNITRGQVTKIVVLGFGIPINTTGGPHFTDVPADNSFYSYIETAQNNGIISGYMDGTFRPFNNVSRGQLSKIVVQAAVIASGWTLINPLTPSFTDVPPGSAFYPYIETAVSKGVVSGYSDRSFRPGGDATRGQISKIVYLAVTQR